MTLGDLTLRATLFYTEIDDLIAFSGGLQSGRRAPA
jgi:hypothetical protein